MTSAGDEDDVRECGAGKPGPRLSATSVQWTATRGERKEKQDMTSAKGEDDFSNFTAAVAADQLHLRGNIRGGVPRRGDVRNNKKKPRGSETTERTTGQERDVFQKYKQTPIAGWTNLIDVALPSIARCQKEDNLYSTGDDMKRRCIDGADVQK